MGEIVTQPTFEQANIAMSSSLCLFIKGLIMKIHDFSLKIIILRKFTYK